MSSTGSRCVGQPALSIYPIFLRKAPRRARGVHRARRAPVRQSRLARHPAGHRGHHARSPRSSFDREHDPTGAGRQLAAIIASGDRTAELQRIAAPTLVIHGSVDPLVSPSGGRATARAIPGAELMMIEGMGHDLPRVLWPRLIDAFAAHAAEADRLIESAAALQQA